MTAFTPEQVRAIYRHTEAIERAQRLRVQARSQRSLQALDALIREHREALKWLGVSLL